MEKTTMKHTNNNQKGQALVFVIATMTVALAVGVGVALRNLSSISRTSRSDTSTRAQAAAEGGAENILSRDEATLRGMADANPANGIDETIPFTPTTNDNVTAVADVKVEYFNIPAGQNYLPLQIKKGQVSEVKLSGGVEVCWTSAESGKGADIFFTSYSSSGSMKKVGYSDSTRAGFPSGYSSTYEGSGGGKDGFNNCVTPSLVSGANILRVRVLNATTNVGVYPAGGSLPAQGFKITSIGKLQNAPQGTDAEAVVTVIRSFAFMPGMFDFGVFSGSTGDAL
jgi:hypothetical protein